MDLSVEPVVFVWGKLQFFRLGGISQLRVGGQLRAESIPAEGRIRGVSHFEKVTPSGIL
jgi:hypothetical protein